MNFSSLLFLSNSYRLTGGNSQFTINPSTGQIITSALLDREARENYTLVVVASDRGFPRALSSSTSVLVSVADVNDNPPKFHHHPYVTHVPSPTTSGNPGNTWDVSNCMNILMKCKAVLQEMFIRCSSIAVFHGLLSSCCMGLNNGKDQYVTCSSAMWFFLVCSFHPNSNIFLHLYKENIV